MAKGLWEWALKFSWPLDYFRIEGQFPNFFIGFGRKNLILHTVRFVLHTEPIKIVKKLT
jgi:hypothetical protein